MSDLVPQEVKEKAHAAIADHLSKPETVPNLLDEVNKLASGAIKISDAFESVKQNLDIVDQANYKDKNGKAVNKFKPTWIGYKQVGVIIMPYTVFLRPSRLALQRPPQSFSKYCVKN